MLDLRYIYSKLYDLFSIYDIDVELGKEIEGYSTITIPIYPDIRYADLIPKLAKSKIAMWIGITEKNISLEQGKGCYMLIINSDRRDDLKLSTLLKGFQNKDKKSYLNPLEMLIGIDIFNTMITLEISDRNPHLIIAGSSGSGKSNLLSNIISQIIERDSNDMISLMIYSPKNEYDKFAGFPFLRYEKIVKEIKDIEACLGDIYLEMSSREKSKGYYNPLLVILDECNSLLSLSDTAKEYIELIAMKGRSSRVHLILSMQSSKKENLSNSPIIRENIISRIIFRVHSKRESTTLSNTPEIDCSRLRIGEAYLINHRGYARVNIPIDDISQGYVVSEPSNPPLALIKGGLGPAPDQNEARDIETVKVEYKERSEVLVIPEDLRYKIASGEVMKISKSKLVDQLSISNDKACDILQKLDDLRLLLPKQALNKPSEIDQKRLKELEDRYPDMFSIGMSEGIPEDIGIKDMEIGIS